MKFKEILPFINCVEFVNIVYLGELHIYLFVYDMDKIKEYAELYVVTISGCDGMGGSYGDTIYFELDDVEPVKNPRGV